VDVLIAESQLIVSEALLTRLVEKVPAVRWREIDKEVEAAYARHFALLDKDLRSELGVAHLSEPVAFYNAYYWMLLFEKRYEARYGFNAGVKDEAVNILERAPAGVDWNVVASVKQVADKAI